MKDELSSKIVEWIENIGNLDSNEVPEFLREVSTYGFYSNLFLGFILFMLAVALFFFLIFSFKSIKNSADRFGAIMGISICITFAGYGFCEKTSECIKAKVSPKLYVIERFIK
jgi:hypothetical protein